MARIFAVALVAVLFCAAGVKGCVELLGHAKDSLAAHSGSSWDYGFKGDDWEGHDANGDAWVCIGSKQQSPINLPGDLNTVEAGDPVYRTRWSYTPMTSTGSNIEIYNNGHTIQVQWTEGALKSSVQVVTSGSHVTDVLSMNPVTKPATKVVTAKPVQFHFHTDSEHTVDGVYYPLELHIVHTIPQSSLPSCPASGCYTVTGVMFEIDLAGRNNTFLDTIFRAAPMREGLKTKLPAGKIIDIQGLLPTDRTFLQYQGSLTTPPCSEGLLWHVFTQPLKMSLNQLRHFQTMVGLKECTNGTAHEEDVTGHRRLHKHTEAGPGAMLARAKKGMTTGFTEVPVGSTRYDTRRRMVEDASGEWTCEVRSYGFNNRMPQSTNGRNIKVYPFGAAFRM